MAIFAAEVQLTLRELGAMIIAASELKRHAKFLGLSGELAVACVVNQEVAEGVASSKVHELLNLTEWL